MRIPKEWVRPMAESIVRSLLEDGISESEVGKDGLVEVVEALLTEELTVEDRLNDEVREMLKAYSDQIDKGRMDFRKLFDMTKQKLVRERGIII